VSSEESPSGPSEREQISALEARYPAGLPAQAREACALSRRNGKLADGVWLRTLQRLGTYSLEASAYALTEFTEKYADGEKREAYLLAIARRAHTSPTNTHPQRPGKTVAHVSTDHTDEDFEWTTTRPN
jgi:hypothetical protein